MIRKLAFLAVVCGLVGFVYAAEPTPEDFALKVEVLSSSESEAEVVVVGSWKVDHVQGWSWGLCHDAAAAKIGDCVALGQMQDPCSGECPEVACPDDMAKPGPDGKPAQFHSVQVYDGGIVQAVVLDFMQSWDLLATDRFELLKVKYSILKADGTDLNFCDTLGQPPVETVFVVGGASFGPATKEGAHIPAGGPPPACTELKIKLAAVEGDTSKVAVLLDTTTDQQISGFQFGITQDTTDLEVLDIVPGSAFGDFDVKNEGFWGVNIIEGKGATLGVVTDLEPQGDPPEWFVLPAETCDQEIAVVSYQCSAGAAGDTATGNVTLTGDLGDPKVEIVVDVDGVSLDPTVSTDSVQVTVTCAPPVGKPFIRGDANQDGRYTVSDGVAIAKAVFNQGSKLDLIKKCMDSADADDNGQVDTADAIYLLTYLFLGGDPIPAPLGACGQDPTDDQLTCEEFQCP